MHLAHRAQLPVLLPRRLGLWLLAALAHFPFGELLAQLALGFGQVRHKREARRPELERTGDDALRRHQIAGELVMHGTARLLGSWLCDILGRERERACEGITLEALRRLGLRLVPLLAVRALAELAQRHPTRQQQQTRPLIERHSLRSLLRLVRFSDGAARLRRALVARAMLEPLEAAALAQRVL